MSFESGYLNILSMMQMIGNSDSSHLSDIEAFFPSLIASNTFGYFLSFNVEVKCEPRANDTYVRDHIIPHSNISQFRQNHQCKQKRGHHIHSDCRLVIR